MVRPKVVLPEKGMQKEEILRKMNEIRSNDLNWESGKVFGYVYHATDEHTEFLKKAYQLFFSENAINPMAFPSLRQFEAELIAMIADLLGGDHRTNGTMTSGGTESILLAMKTYREWAYKKKGIKHPEVVLPISAHPAFDKAAYFFNLKKIHIPLTEDYRVDINAVKEAITENTIAVVGSACDFPRGVVDPIPQLAAIAQENGIGCHVDACLGGFMLPWLKKLGYDITDFDLSVPGVSSLSVDLHKYGYTAKGASIILYQSRKLHRYQIYAYTDWSGGVYASATMTGTRPGATIAAAWAGLNTLGKEGYLHLAKITMETAEKFINGINSIPELYVLGEPSMTVFSFTSDISDMYILGDIMQKKGWLLDRLQFPPCLHLIINPHHANVIDQFLRDIEDSVKEAKTVPSNSSKGSATMYGMMARSSDRKTIEKTVVRYLQDLYDL